MIDNEGKPLITFIVTLPEDSIFEAPQLIPIQNLSDEPFEMVSSS